MSVAFWCILAASLMPYLLSVLSRWGTPKAQYVGDPRGFNETLTGWRRRAHLAQLNAFESFPPFAAAVLVAEAASAPAARIDLLALFFVGFRLLHATLYVADRPQLRSVAWQLGMLCIVGLFIVAAL
jgi:uncharacterized MAPEG superfamily protein